MLSLAIGFIIGLYCGLAAARWLKASEKPIFLRRRTRYPMTPGVRVAPTSHFEQWVLWTHRFMLFCEVLAHERGKPPGRLPSYADFGKATGISWRKFEPYLEALENGGVVYVERGGMSWAVGKGARRAQLTALPYPSDRRPPRFPFARDTCDSAG